MNAQISILFFKYSNIGILLNSCLHISDHLKNGYILQIKLTDN